MPNRLACKSIQKGWLEEFIGYDDVIPEVKISIRPRIDLLLQKEGKKFVLWK